MSEWIDIKLLNPKDQMVVIGWGEYRDRYEPGPAFMRFSEHLNSWSVSAMPFYPTHWMPIPKAPKQD